MRPSGRFGLAAQLGVARSQFGLACCRKARLCLLKLQVLCLADFVAVPDVVEQPEPRVKVSVARGADRRVEPVVAHATHAVHTHAMGC